MTLSDLLDSLSRRPIRGHVTVALPDSSTDRAETVAEDEDAYFQLRLSEMQLTDERRWHQEVAPATLLLTDFQYGGSPARVPFFVSNALLEMGPATRDGPDLKHLRVRLRDTLVAGPVPYTGGDVSVFAGLFQVELKNYRTLAFSVFEKLFGVVDAGAVGAIVKLAGKLSGDMFSALGMDEVRCLIAEQRVLNVGGGMPTPGYLAFLSAQRGPAMPQGLLVLEGGLHRLIDGVPRPVADHDYCLVRVEQLAARSDYSSMAFHGVFGLAREKMLAGAAQEAQALMLDCSKRIFASPDLTERHKVRLIEFYQAKLFAVQRLLRPLAGTERDGVASMLRSMEQRAAQALITASKAVHEGYSVIASLESKMDASLPDDASLHAHLVGTSGPTRWSGEVLRQALTVGAMAEMERRHGT